MDIETRKIEAEIRKLESDTATARSNQLRGWVTTLSVIVGIIVSGVGVYQTLTEIAFKNRQLGIEAQVRSHEIFLNQVLDRMSGIKANYHEVDARGALKLVRRETFGGVTQVGAYAAAVSLSCEFENLRRPTEQALKFQIALIPDDPMASEMLKTLRDQCGVKSNK